MTVYDRFHTVSFVIIRSSGLLPPFLGRKCRFLGLFAAPKTFSPTSSNFCTKSERPEHISAPKNSSSPTSHDFLPPDQPNSQNWIPNLPQNPIQTNLKRPPCPNPISRPISPISLDCHTKPDNAFTESRLLKRSLFQCVGEEAHP